MKKVLVLGAGYACISFLKDLPDTFLNQAEFILISQNDFHCLTIGVHKIASGVKNESEIFALKKILNPKIKILKECVIEIKDKYCITEKNRYFYDFLVVGLGASVEDFGIKGVREYAFTMLNYENSLKIYHQINKKLAMLLDNQALSIAVCGAGLSGVELVSLLAESMPKKHKDKIFQIHCIEAMTQILPMFSTKMAAKAQCYLKNLNVKIHLNSKVIECIEGGLVLEKANILETIQADIIIWTAGIRGSKVIESSSYLHSFDSKIRQSRIQVSPYLSIPSKPNIFIIGDCAICEDKNAIAYAPTAQIAIKQGMYLAKIFDFVLKEKEIPFEFDFRSKGLICSLGTKLAVGILGKKESFSRLALFIKCIIELKWRYKIGGIKGILKALK